VLAGNLLAGANDARDAAVLHREMPELAALALELEAKLGAIDGDVTVPQGRETVALVFLRVIGIADADQCLFKKAHDRRKHFAARQARPFHIGGDTLADAR